MLIHDKDYFVLVLIYCTKLLSLQIEISNSFRTSLVCLNTTRSCSFSIQHKRDTGRKFEGSELSLFFGNDITFEYFQNSANFPSLKDLLNKILKSNDISLATGFNILLLIPSGPLALFEFKISISDCISSGVYTIFNYLFWYFVSKAGSWLLSSLIVEMEVKISFKHSSFSKSV